MHRVILVSFSAILAATTFPPLGWWPIALVAWWPLWSGLSRAGGLYGFRLGLLHGMLLYAFTLAWFWNIFGVLACGLWLILAAFTGLVGAIFGSLTLHHHGKWWIPVLGALVWTGTEFFRSEWFTLSFPWITPGIAIGPTAMSPLLGVYSATYLLMFAACSLACGLRRQGGVAIIVLLALVVWRPKAPQHDKPETVRVAAVQGESLDYLSYLKMTRDSDITDAVIVWPEYAALYYAAPSTTPWGDAISLCKEKNLILVFGRLRHDTVGNPRKFNEALTIDSSGIVGNHVKNRPVHLMDDGEKGTTANPVETWAGKIATPICFDCDAQWVCRRMVANGAEWIAAPTMDALHWGKTQKMQHAELFRHRAAENGRWVVVAATSGLTQIIDPAGQQVLTLPWPEEGVLQGSIGRRSKLTVFTRGGWLFGPFCFVGMISTVILVFWHSIHRGKSGIRAMAGVQ